jgi:hypothetical protein
MLNPVKPINKEVIASFSDTRQEEILAIMSDDSFKNATTFREQMEVAVAYLR